MRAMTGAGASTSDVEIVDESSDDASASDEDGSSSASDDEEDDDDHHDFDDSFDEITDDDDNHNFSFNLEEHEQSDSDEHTYGTMDTLHDQVVDFVKKNQMSDHEVGRRKHVFDAIERAIARQYLNHKDCSLHVFGSGATGLALAGADLDLVLLGVGPQSRKGGGGGFTRSEREEIVQHLRKMARYLRQVNAVSRAEVIATAKVPIVKMKSASPPYIAVDLSLGTTNGLEAVYWIREQVETFAALKPLVFYLKRLLATHHLNDASTGGCGGYLLVSLVVSHLKQTGSVGAVNRPGMLGDLLLGFLRRFGSVFDYKTNAVAAGRESGVMSCADLPGPPFGTRPYIMAEDPQERFRCFTAAAYRFREVQNLFRLAAEHMTVSGELSLLSDVAAPAPRATGSFFKGGQVIKVRKGSNATSHKSGASGSTKTKQGGMSHLFRKANAKSSFAENKADWTDGDGGNRKRPRAATAWSSDGHKGHGGHSNAPAKRRRLPGKPGAGAKPGAKKTPRAARAKSPTAKKKNKPGAKKRSR
ncbi:hypothetical protein BE221DRAFT_189655 [Ostreococcus tauri]|uniref:Poly(A) RNA polymerase mitochondrial-like central palm domain-containing protein n=1 Tax=Ostreococcus tauri TaxID=70448 RepID=A0A1Y5IFM8_OSTTA|nr:hypothetical protein BE221DRAFT_189655 [Ostreococcus tauri]